MVGLNIHMMKSEIEVKVKLKEKVKPSLEDQRHTSSDIGKSGALPKLTRAVALRAGSGTQ